MPAFVSNESKIKKSADECRGKNVLFSVMPEEALLCLVCARAAEAFGFLLTNEKNTGEVTRTPKTNTTA